MTTQEAIDKYDTHWWENSTPQEIASFQITEERLCCPFAVFHTSVEKWLGRSVWTHEFANPNALIAEHEGKKIFEGPITSLAKMITEEGK